MTLPDFDTMKEAHGFDSSYFDFGTMEKKKVYDLCRLTGYLFMVSRIITKVGLDEKSVRTVGSKETPLNYSVKRFSERVGNQTDLAKRALAWYSKKRDFDFEFVRYYKTLEELDNEFPKILPRVVSEKNYIETVKKESYLDNGFGIRFRISKDNVFCIDEEPEIFTKPSKDGQSYFEDAWGGRLSRDVSANWCLEVHHAFKSNLDIDTIMNGTTKEKRESKKKDSV